MAPSSIRSILVKGTLPDGGTAFSLDSVPFTTQPLFCSIGRSGTLGVEAAQSWHIVSSGEMTEAHLWDVSHAMVRQGFGIAGSAPPAFAEPNLAQQWFGDDHQDLAQSLAATGGARGPDTRYPTLPDFAWYRDPAHGNMPGGECEGAGVRVAHLDTGFDPQHLSVPLRLNRALERNFVDAAYPGDATDRTVGGMLSNFGHGTGTLSILAGNAIAAGAGDDGAPATGAAPQAEVVCVRVANGVVLFETATVAQGLDYVHALVSAQDPAQRIDVVTMSMGGLASQAWAEAVNALYDAGVFVVTAAGNNYGNLPTRNIVFPARFKRVVAACGVMADLMPYVDFDRDRMAGNYGPASKMDTALAAFTPNVPWAQIGSPRIVHRDGHGTSSATPQIAAAAARWLGQHRAVVDALPEAWMRVEAIRRALFDSARHREKSQYFGNGTVNAAAALALPPADRAMLQQQPPDDARFPLLRTLTGMGLQAVAPEQLRMLELEALQLSQNAAVEALLNDRDDAAAFTYREMRTIADALASDPHASRTLRENLAPATGPRTVAVPNTAPSTAMQKMQLAHAVAPPVTVPQFRALRIFAYDPSLETDLPTLAINEALVRVRWESLGPGPVGEYIEVIDVDPAGDACYAPVDLDDPALLAQNGRAPAESNAQFHQQMVYAVSMKTIEHFERALGRVALWSPRTATDGTQREEFVRRLRIYPHALAQPNAFYSPVKKALLFGYFSSNDVVAGLTVPGTLVFGCLSYDIVAHETTHALLDGLHRRYQESSNPDMLAFHEAFADIVALFQHFTVYEAVRDQLAQTRGDLHQKNLLGQLAFQFGQARGGRGALRSYIGREDDKGVWQRLEPQRSDYAQAKEAHERGAVLVAAVFDAFLRIYGMRYDELLRLASGGSGVLPPGNLPDTLVDALAREVSRLASDWLEICIRALDYCPPVDLTFGDYLRALVTADTDISPEDERSYRVAFVSAFRDRGIYADGVRNVSPGTLVWEPPPLELTSLKAIVDDVSLSWNLHTDRAAAYRQSQTNASHLHAWLASTVTDDEIAALGLLRLAAGERRPMSLGGEPGTLHGVEVHSVRPARRTGTDGQSRIDLVVEITQSWHADRPDLPVHRGGVTLIVDLETASAKYFVRKRVADERRYTAQKAFAAALSDSSLRGNYFSSSTVREPFAFLHRSIAGGKVVAR